MSKEWQEYQKLKAGGLTGKDMYFEYQSLKGHPEQPKPTGGLQAAPMLRDYVAPTPQPSTTDVRTPMARGMYENRIEEKPLSFMESAREVLGGIASGASFGMAEPDPQFSERPASKVAQFIGEFGPVQGLASVGKAALKPLAKNVTSKVGKVATRAGESAIGGGLYSTIKQGAQGDIAPTEVGKEAALWGGIDATLGSLGLAGKMIRSYLQRGDRKAAMKVVEDGFKGGSIPEESANIIRRTISKLDETGYAPASTAEVEGVIKANVGPAPLPTPKLRPQGLDETVPPLRPKQGAVEHAGRSPYATPPRFGNVNMGEKMPVSKTDPVVPPVASAQGGKELTWETPDEYVYHRTSPNNLESIRRSGLLRGRAGEYPHGRQDIADVVKRIYFGESPTKTSDFGGGLVMRVRKDAISDNVKVVKMGVRGEETWYFGDKVNPSDIEVRNSSGGWDRLARGKRRIVSSTPSKPSPVSTSRQLPTSTENLSQGAGKGGQTSTKVYHGTTEEAANLISQQGITRGMFADTYEQAYESAVRTANRSGGKPVVLEVDAITGELGEPIPIESITGKSRGNYFDKATTVAIDPSRIKRATPPPPPSPVSKPSPVSTSRQLPTSTESLSPVKATPDLAVKPVEGTKGKGPNAYSLAGGVAGFEQDEEGNVGYDPVRGAIGLGVGLAGVYGANKFQKNQKPVLEATGPKKSPVVPEKAPTVSERIPVTESGRVQGINLNNYKAEGAAKKQMADILESGAKRMERDLGAPITLAEVEEAAKSATEYKSVLSRQQQLEREASLLATRQKAITLNENPNASISEIKQIFETLRVVRSHAAEHARGLGSLRISAGTEWSNRRLEVLAKLEKLGVSLDDIEKAGTNVDWNDGRQIVQFYRQFVKPKLGEYIETMRYGNMLSSPLTHIVNTASNLAQVGGVRPVTYLASGAVDNIASLFRNDKAREYYVRQAPAYLKGAFNKSGEAWSKALDAFSGKSFMQRPDLEGSIPTGKAWMKPWEVISQTLDASDVFFRTLAEGGEMEALAYKAKRTGKAINPVATKLEAVKNAESTIFRAPLDPTNKTGQGLVSTAMDIPAYGLQQASRIEAEIAGKTWKLGAPIRWFVPFVRTPLNIAKQGMEFTPLGFGNMIGNAKKTEAFAKAMTGSMVMGGAGYLAMEGRTTWAAPKGSKEKAAFYDAGMQPYSVKVGDEWVSYQRLGPLAYPIALAAAYRYYHEDSPSKLTDSEMAKFTNTLSALGTFFSDQSYVQGIGNLLKAVKGEQGGTSQAISSIPDQMIPLSSLQRWATRLTDPYYRDADRDLSVDALIQQVMKDVPGLSQKVPPIKGAFNKPAEKPNRIGNAFSPVQFRTEDSTKAANYRLFIKDKQLRNQAEKNR